jgi:hypothetical protein
VDVPGGVVQWNLANSYVVTIDWIVHCLQLGNYFIIYILVIILLIILSLSGYKVNLTISDIFFPPVSPAVKPYVFKHKTSGERFTKYDIVYYGSSEKDCKIGQIINFSRRHKTHPGSATIRPLFGSNIDSHELNFSDVSNNAIDTNFIIKKVIVLQKKQYFTLKYPRFDNDIYYSSKILDEIYEQELTEGHESSPTKRNLSKVQSSQDF